MTSVSRYSPDIDGDQPDSPRPYPLDIRGDYPESDLSRGLWLVKWLLAIPHYLLIGIFVGSGSALQGGITNLFVGREVLQYGQQFADEAAVRLGWQLIGTGLSIIPDAVGSTLGLVGMLGLIALVTLLFRGRYPRDMFEFLMGLNRWVNRVYGYALLLYDDYPPFRLSS